MTSQTNPDYWVHLVDCNGEPYKRASTDTISLPHTANVMEITNAAQRKYASILDGVHPSQLTVYKHKSAFDAKEGPLKDDAPLDGLGFTLREALVVVVPEVPAPRWNFFGRKKSTAVFPTPEIAVHQPLLQREAKVYMKHPPICSVTFFKGDVATAQEFL
jgi:hypothetical protein